MKRLALTAILSVIVGVFAWKRHHHVEEDYVDETARYIVEEPGLIGGWGRPL